MNTAPEFWYGVVQGLHSQQIWDHKQLATGRQLVSAIFRARDCRAEGALGTAKLYIEQAKHAYELLESRRIR